MSRVPRDRVHDLVREHGDQIVDLAATLVRTPSDLPDHPEVGVVDLLREAVNRLGLPEPTLLAARPDRPNLLVRMSGSTVGRRLVLTGHTDTKPPGPRELWASDPWGGIVNDGRLTGLSSGDVKAALAAMVHAAAILNELGEPRSGELILLFTADEEYEGECGLRYALEVTDLKADGAIIGEPSGLLEPFDRIGLASRGFFGFTLRATGTARHSSLSDEVPTVNPIEELARVVADLRREQMFADETHPLYPGGATVNVATSIHGGVAAGVVPETAESRGDVRLLPGTRATDAEAALGRALESLRLDRPAGAIQLVGDTYDWPGAEIDPRNPLARTLLGVVSEVLGRDSSPGGFLGATEAHLLERRGIPTIPAAGPGVIIRAHAPNEWVEVDAIIAATEVYALTVLDFLSQ